MTTPYARILAPAGQTHQAVRKSTGVAIDCKLGVATAQYNTTTIPGDYVVVVS